MPVNAVGPATATGAPIGAAEAKARAGEAFGRRAVLVTALPWVLFLVLHLLSISPLVLGPVVIYLQGPHVLATFGLYLDRDLSRHMAAHRPAYFLAPVAAIVTMAVAFAVTSGRVTYLLYAAFLLWQTHHFTKQNLGMFSFWCRARSLPGMTDAERTLLRSTSAIGILGVLHMMDLAPQFETWLRGLGLGAIAVGLVLALRPGAPARKAALVAAVLFYAPLHVFDLGIAAAALSFQAAHGAQYYLMVGEVVRRDRRVVKRTVAFVLLGGLALTAASRVDPLGGNAWVFGLAEGVVAGHFLVDARIWRLSTPDIRAVMKQRFAFL